MKLGATWRGRAVSVANLPAGDDGIAATVAAMQAMIDHAVHDPRTRPKLSAALREAYGADGVPAGPWPMAAALFAWFKARVGFKRDPVGMELLIHPLDVLTVIERKGRAMVDCDDLAVLGCSLLALAGYRPVLVTVGRRAGGRFEHVFFGIRDGGAPLSRESVIALDPQEEQAAGRWPDVARVKLWGLSVSDYNE